MADTLVLNRSFHAVQVSGWRRSITLLYQGHAEAVDEGLRTYDFADWVELSRLMREHPRGFVHTATLRIAVPEVIRLTRYDKLPKEQVKFTRRSVYEHYGCTCCYCGRSFKTSELNLDHVLPRSRGGMTTWENIVLSCIPCNTRKDNRTPKEAGMRLLVRPSKPRWMGLRSMMAQLPAPIPVSWQRLIDRAYWESELEP